MSLYHSGMEQVPVKHLPKRILDHYIEEYERIGYKEDHDLEEMLELNCSYGFSWSSSTLGGEFWDNVFSGKWEKEWDEEISEEEIVQKVLILIKSIVSWLIKKLYEKQNYRNLKVGDEISINNSFFGTVVSISAEGNEARYRIKPLDDEDNESLTTYMIDGEEVWSISLDTLSRHRVYIKRHMKPSELDSLINELSIKVIDLIRIIQR